MGNGNLLQEAVHPFLQTLEQFSIIKSHLQRMFPDPFFLHHCVSALYGGSELGLIHIPLNTLHMGREIFWRFPWFWTFFFQFHASCPCSFHPSTLLLLLWDLLWLEVIRKVGHILISIPHFPLWVIGADRSVHAFWM